MIIKGYRGKRPQISSSAFIAEGTIIIGDFCMGEYSGLWYGTIARADVDRIIIGNYTNIQDNCTIHCDQGIPTVIGDYVTVGHNAVLHGCRIANNCLIGMGAIVMDGVEIGEYSIIGAGSLIPPGKNIAPGSVVMGSPGRVVRSITEREKERIRESANGYVDLAKEYLTV